MNLSAKTSINKTKVPYLFSHNPYWRIGSYNLDIGGGKYNTATDYLWKNFHINNLIYDPYNRTEEENEIALSRDSYDTVTLSNVLNVILDEKERIEALRLAKTMSKEYVFITVYEGDKSGVPSKTQLNKRLREYIPEVLSVFRGSYSIKIKYRMIIIRKCN